MNERQPHARLLRSLTRYALVAWLILGSTGIARVQAQWVLEKDSLALIALYNATGGPGWTGTPGQTWLQGPIYNWIGVSTTLNNEGPRRVTHIFLLQSNLTGELPEQLTDLDALETLTITNSELTGPLSAFLGRMTSLESITLFGNQLMGPIPDSLGNLTKLTRLDLRDNQLTDAIPEALGNLTQLETLVLSGNGFTGAIPKQVENLAALERLWLDQNQLSDMSAPDWGKLQRLQVLRLDHNNLKGAIPEALGGATSLTYLSLDFNALTDTLPASLGQLTALTELRLQANGLEGSLAPLATLNNLEFLSVDLNKFTGAVPASLAGAANLQALTLSSNLLEDLPDLSGLASLRTVGAYDNRFTYEDLEPYAGFLADPDKNFLYIPQARPETRQAAQPDGSVVLSVDVGGTATTYQWFRNDEAIPDATDSTYTASVLEAFEGGEYYARTENPLLPGLIIVSEKVTLEGDCPGKISVDCSFGFVVTVDSDGGFEENPDTGQLEFPENHNCDLDAVTDGIQCSLRAAIQLVNAGFGRIAPDEPAIIGFEIPVPDQTTPVIVLQKPLPSIEQPVEILGGTQEFGGTGSIIIDGSEAGDDAGGLVLEADGNTISGLHIRKFKKHGILIHSNGNTVERCTLSENGKSGLVIDLGHENTVKENNVFSNTENGVGIGGEESPTFGITPARLNTLEGNNILANDIGVFIGYGEQNTLKGNVISGNSLIGVLISTSKDDRLEGNKIGVDAHGVEHPNGTDSSSKIRGGIVIIGSPGVTIGDENVISGNGSHGIWLQGDVTGIKIQNNVIGADASGTLPLGNLGHGIGSKSIGGNTETHPHLTITNNVISANDGTGIHLEGNASFTIAENNIGVDIDSGCTFAIDVENLRCTLGNGTHGIEISNRNAISVSGSITGNVIAANHQSGISLSHGLLRLAIERNAIGYVVEENLPLGNGWYGIESQEALQLTIAENVITANGSGGLYAFGEGQRTVEVTSNVIGVGTSIEEAGFGNEGDGVHLEYMPGVRPAKITDNVIGYNEGDGVEVDEVGDVSILNNTIVRNTGAGVRAADIPEVILLLTNLIEGNQGDGTGIHLTATDAVIEGNQITDDAGDAITLEDASTATVSGNNIFDNHGLGLSNLTPSVMVTAPGNWWGDPSGPGGAGPGAGQAVSTGVDVSGWLSERVAVVVAAEDDEVLLPIGEADTLSVFLQNWQHRTDALDLTVSDTEDWLQSAPSFTVTLDDLTGAEARLAVAVPAGTPNGATSTVEVTATSQADAGHAATTTFTLRAESAALAQVLVVPAVVEVAPGDTVLFGALGLDQFSRTVEITPTWSATGGVIDADGLYMAGSTTGVFEVTATDPATGLSGTARVGNGVAVATEEAEEAPTAFRLHQNYPNPFNPETTIPYVVPAPEQVRLVVYDVLGRQVAVLVDAAQPAGTHQAAFDAARLPSGVYFYRLTAGRFSRTRTMIVLK